MAKRKRGYEARLEKRALVLSHDPDLPAVCMKCGSHDRITREPQIFHWQPVWSRFLLICGIGVILMFLMRQSASLEIPLCPPCTKRWSAGRTARVLGIVAIVIAFATRIFLGLDHNRLGIGIVLATIAAFVALNVTFVRKRQLRASAIDEDEIGLLGVHPTAIEEVLLNARPPQPPPPASAS
jgi:hypothetical protein